MYCSSGAVTLYWNAFYRATGEAGVLTAYFTGSRATTLARMHEEEAVSCVLEDVRRQFPQKTAP